MKLSEIRNPIDRTSVVDDRTYSTLAIEVRGKHLYRRVCTYFILEEEARESTSIVSEIGTEKPTETHLSWRTKTSFRSRRYRRKAPLSGTSIVDAKRRKSTSTGHLHRRRETRKSTSIGHLHHRLSKPTHLFYTVERGTRKHLYRRRETSKSTSIGHLYRRLSRPESR